MVQNLARAEIYPKKSAPTARKKVELFGEIWGLSIDFLCIFMHFKVFIRGIGSFRG